MTYKGKKAIRMVGRICGRERRGYIIAEFADHTVQKFDIYYAAFTESEPIDMRKWRGVYTHAEKDKLAVFLHENLLYGQLLREKKNNITQEEKSEAFRQMKEIVAARTSPKYAIADSPDEAGNYSIADTDTGELLPLFAVYFEEYNTWTVVEYLPAGQ